MLHHQQTGAETDTCSGGDSITKNIIGIEEKTIFQEKPPWKAYIGLFILAIFITLFLYYTIFTSLPQITATSPQLNRFVIYIYIAPIIISLLIICAAPISRYSHIYTLTKKYAVSRMGLIRRDERTAPISKITDTRVFQGIWQRILGYGDVQINTAGSSGYEVNFINIDNPYYVKRKIDELIEKIEETDKR